MTIDGQEASIRSRKDRAQQVREGAIDEESYSQRRACALVGFDPKTYR